MGSKAKAVELAGRQCSATLEVLRTLFSVPDLAPPQPAQILLLESSSWHQILRSNTSHAPENPLFTINDRRGRLLIVDLDRLDGVATELRSILATDLVEGLLASAGTWLRRELIYGLSHGELSQSAMTLPTSPRADYPTLLPYLMVDGSDRRVQLSRFLKLARAGTPDELAFDIAFGGDIETVAAESRRHRLTDPAQIGLSLGPRPAQRLDRLESAIRLGDAITRAAPIDTVAAELNYREALEIEPSDSRALAGIAVIRDLDGRWQDADQAWQQALLAGPLDVTSQTLFGWHHIDVFLRENPFAWNPDSAWTQRLLTAQAACGQALALSPGLPAAQHCHALATLYVAPTKTNSEPLVEMTSARSWHPHDPGLRVDWILAHALAGDALEAWMLLRAGQDSVEALPPESVQRIERQLTDLALARVQQKVLDDDPIEARRELSAALEYAPSEALRQLDEQLEEIVEQRQLDEWITVHNEAAVMVQSGNYTQARPLLLALAEQPLPNELSASVARLLSLIEKSGILPD